MMNLLAICLVVASLATAGVFSPSPEKPSTREDVIVRQSHRVVVVEYDRTENGNTKVVISPQSQPQTPPHAYEHHTSSVSYAQNQPSATKEKLKEASSFPPNTGQGLSGSDTQPNWHGRHRPRELMCDALGRCKHKMASALGKAKEKVHEVEEEAKDVVSESLGKAREAVGSKAHKVEVVAKEAAGKAKHAAEEALKMSERLGKYIQGNASEVAKEKTEKAKDTAGIVLTDWVSPALGVLNLLGFATAYGMCVWVTFVSSYVLAEALPREQFAMVQSKIYPAYFGAVASGVGVALLSHLLSHRRRLFTGMSEMFQGYNLLACLLMLLANLFYLEPQATKVMFERMKTEKEEGRGGWIDGSIAEPSSRESDQAAPTTSPFPTATSDRRAEQEAIKLRIAGLNERLKNLNTYSSFLNILTLVSLTWHLVYLGQCLQTQCPAQ